MYNNTRDYENIVFIGGSYMREFPVSGKNVIYINPVLAPSDVVNNAMIIGDVRVTCF
jgi:hypothetical protein